MDEVLVSHEEPLVEAEVVDRPNRFVLEVAVNGGTERAYLADPGRLDVLESGTTVLCSPAGDPDRETEWDAIAAVTDSGHVSLRAAFANRLFLEAFRAAKLPMFEGYQFVESEPQYPMRGRADFLLAPPDGSHDVYVEVKSCTHVEDGVGLFPDRQTERGRRHLRCLDAVTRGGNEAHVVFVAQHPEIDAVAPYEAVDPEFAALLSEVAVSGVGVHAIGTAFTPPEFRLRAPQLPVELS